MSSGIPQGIEVLVSKASVDPEFKAVLLEQRAGAAELIGLRLEPAEAQMLAAVPAEQLEATIARTSVPPEHRRAFLGRAAAAMLAAMAAMAPVGSAAEPPPPKGIAPDPPPAPRGIRPDLPPEKPPAPKPKEATIADRVVEIIARHFQVEPKDITLKTAFVEDLNAQPEDMVTLKVALEKQFRLRIPPREYRTFRTVGRTIDWIERAIKRQSEEKPPPPGPTKGIRPDLPPPKPGDGPPK